MTTVTTGALAAVAGTYCVRLDGLFGSQCYQALTYIFDHGFSMCREGQVHVIPWYIMAGVYAFCILLGAVLPDIDSNQSIIGRHFHLKMQHRTWTHAIWIPGILCILGMSFLPCMFIGASWFLHLLIDSLSRQGVCWFYPFSDYFRYDSGAAVKKRHYIWLYRTRAVSETAVFVVWVGVCVAIALYYGILQNGFLYFWYLFCGCVGV